MTEIEAIIDAEKILDKIGKRETVHNNSYWMVWYTQRSKNGYDFIMVKREHKDRSFYICRSYFGMPYSNGLDPLRLFQQLIKYSPGIVAKLAEPV